MAAQLEHRGPDDYGEYLDPQRRCALSFRRLSIIDVDGGAQPIANEDGTVHAILNGEVYNYRELRERLRRAGHRFSTDGDAETVVHLIEESRVDCVEQLTGMFALAVWDERDGRLLLARDRFGKKPLTYCIADGLLYAVDLSGFLHCLDLATGRNIWTYDTLAAVWGSPYLVDGKVYLGDEDGDVVVLEHGNRTNKPKVLAENLMNDTVYGTPVAAKGVLYVMTRSHLYAMVK